MSVQLDRIVPWGRSMREYQLLFSLTEADLRRKILGCGDGPASFNAEMTSRGCSVVSCDPIYVFTAEHIRQQFESSLETVLSQVRRKPQNYVWTYHRSPEDLRAHRESVMREFVADYGMEGAKSRYIVGELPRLPFAEGEFELALCSHLLFLYSELLSLEFHFQSVVELVRVAGEARIFPLVGLDCQPSPHLGPLCERLVGAGLKVEIARVNYQFQRNGDSMLKVTR